MSTIRIVVVDDNPAIRRGLTALLQSEPGFSVVGSGKDGLEGANLVKRFRPDVLITDIFMPLLDGIEVIKRTIRHSPLTRVVVFSLHGDESYALTALSAGAMAYVTKGCDDKELVHAIREVIADRQCVVLPLSENPVGHVRGDRDTERSDDVL